jgi:hypothetical protein
MTMILTASGRMVDLMYLDPSDIEVNHITHCLARIARFNGLTTYSVAAHSIHVSEILEGEGDSALVQLVGLLHDAHEAYIGDITTPVKQLFAPRAIELSSSMVHSIDLRMQKVVLMHFGLWAAHAGCYKRVRRADLTALATERRDLLPSCDAEWECLRGVTPHATNLAERESWAPQRAMAEFNARLLRLQKQVAADMELLSGGRRLSGLVGAGVMS